MELINNTTKTLRDDLSVEMKKGSKLSIAAACFSIYAFQELKKQLSDIDELRFIFTSPTFITEKAKKEKREFYIPRLNRERSLYGTEFEIKLRNELTQKAIAKECAEWIKKKVSFKSNISDKTIQGGIVVDDVGYTPINNFTTIELGCEKGNVISTTIVKDNSLAKTLLADFNEIWNDNKVLQEVTDDSKVMNYLSKLQEAVAEANYDTIMYTLSGIDKWYEENIGAISSNEYVFNLESHQKNMQLIKEILSGLKKDECVLTASEIIDAKLSNSLVKDMGRCSLDIEMETGTGKTYVYIKTMFELNKKYGWSKFIVVVPSIAIREGVKKSFEITADHFMEHYGKKARFFIYNSSNLNQLDNFSSSSGINVMIINTQAFASSLKEDGRSKEARIIYSKRDEFGCGTYFL